MTRKSSTVSDAVKANLASRLRNYGAEHWPDFEFEVSWRGRCAYVEAVRSTTTTKLCRLSYLGEPDEWEFGFYQYSTERYELSFLPSGSFTGSPEECLDCAGVYLLSTPLDLSP